MKIKLACLQCMLTGNLDPSKFLNAVLLNNDRSIRVECSSGHVTRAVVQNEMFELLSDSALSEFAGEDYRHSVQDFAVSLEKLQEFYVRAAARSMGLPDEELTNSSRSLGKLSERKLGLFTGIYLARHNTAPKLLSDEFVSIRNKVVHQGHFPDEPEARRYALAVIEVVRPLLQNLRSEPLSPFVEALTRQSIAHRYTAAFNEEALPTTNSFVCFFSLTHSDIIDFDTALAASRL